MQEPIYTRNEHLGKNIKSLFKIGKLIMFKVRVKNLINYLVHHLHHRMKIINKKAKLKLKRVNKNKQN